MKNAEAILSVKFNSMLSADELMNAYQEDLETFKNLPGLLQKYYMTEECTGAILGIYIFETKPDREAFRASELAKKIPLRYGMIPGTLRIELYDMASVLNDVLLA
ncbi:MAG: hypothetical protein ABI675_05000 [Chitinophagaceae bacterium]